MKNQVFILFFYELFLHKSKVYSAYKKIYHTYCDRFKIYSSEVGNVNKPAPFNSGSSSNKRSTAT